MLFVVADRWDATLGGRERYADDLITHLTVEGRQVTRVVRGLMAPPLGARVLALSPVSYATHYQLHGGLAAQAFAAERASLSSALRRAAFPVGLRLNRRRQRLLCDEGELVGGRAALMAFSESTARDLIGRSGVSADRVIVSRPGVNLQLFRPPELLHWRRPDRTMRLAFVAHNFALKGLRSAIAAVAQATRSGVAVTLSIAGRGRPSFYQRLADALGVRDRVAFVGALSQTEVSALFRESDALIHPSYYDPFPRVAIEALACGCPVITTAGCGAAEILSAGSDGFVVDNPADVAGLATAIVSLADRATRDRMRHAAAESGQRFDQVSHFRTMSTWLFESGGHR